MIYKITFQVKTPIIVTAPLHFDALLAAVHPAMHNLNAINRRSDADDVTQAPLAIDSAKIGDTWVYCCTAADYSDDARPFTSKITKRKDGIDYYYLVKKQAPRTGTGRDRCDTIYGVVCSSISFWASTRYPTLLAKLCKRVKNIGTLRKMGYGEVTGFEITPDESLTWQGCLIRYGRAVRNLPAEMVCNYSKLSQVVVRPPYYVAALRRSGIAEGTEAELVEEVWFNEYKRTARRELHGEQE